MYVGNQIFGVKWRNWKMMMKELEDGYDATKNYSVPRFYNLYLDPKEEHWLNYAKENLWVRWPIGQVLAEHMASLQKEPPIPPGAPDPYTPPARSKASATPPPSPIEFNAD